MADHTRLLILTHNYPRFQGDYAGVFIALLARRLMEQEVTPVVLAPHDAGYPEFEIMDGISVYRFRYAETDTGETIAYRGNMHQLVLGSVSGPLRFKRFLDAYRSAALKVISSQRIQVVAGNWLVPSGIIMKTLGARTALPMVLSSHGTDVRLLTRYASLARHYFSPLAHRIDRWTVVSTFLRDEIIRIDPRTASKLEVLPVPHDETVFFRDDGIAREPHLIVAVTRFIDQKRVPFLVKAFAQVNAQNPSARLELYGSGPLQAQIEALIASLGLQECVKICNPVPQAALRRVYNRAALVVLNSSREGFGLALSEAMMCGACVVGTKSGGITDIIKDGETGRLVDVDNAAQLADALIQLLRDAGLRGKLAAAGHQYAHATYASGPLAARYAEIIKTAAHGSR